MLRAIAAATFAALALSATAVRADNPVRVSEVCKTEIASLCTERSEGNRRGHRTCLEQNEAKLGAACAGAVKIAREQREKVRTACEADLAKHCKDADGTGGAGVQCLKSKQAELTKPCADILAAIPQRTARN